MITSYGSPSDIAYGLDLGADDYVAKPIDPAVLTARIKARFRQSPPQDDILTVSDLELNQQTHEVKRGDKLISLSPQEYKLLRYFMLNENRVLSREMILTRIWESSPDIETRVVDVYVGYLRKKIDFKKPLLLHSIRGFGYVMRVRD